MWRDKSAMVVEDDEAIRAVLAQALDFEMGAYTVVAPDGEEAVRWAQRVAPTIVVLDLMLPRLDGFEVARRLRAEPGGQSIELVAMSGWGHPRAREQAVQAGFDRHFLKPITLGHLTALLGPVKRQAAATGR